MTAINLQNIIEITQRKIAAVDSNSSTRDLENLMELTMLTGGGHKADSSGFDSDVPNYVGRLVFIDSGSEGYFKFNTTIAGAPSASSNQNFTQILKDGTYTPYSPPPLGFSVASINGSAYGFRATGGWPGSYVSNVIDKYSYTSDGNASDVGDLTGNKAFSISGSTKTHGYSYASYPAGVAEKWSHTSDGNSTQIPGLSTPTYFGTGNTSDTYHYITQGYNAFTPSVGNPNINTDIVRAPIASEDAWSDTGMDWSQVTGSSGQGMAVQSHTHGYVLSVGGGYPRTAAGTNKIEKFPFAAEDATSDVGDMTHPRSQKTDNSYNNTYGFSSGGNNPSSSAPTVLNEIERISFASDGNGTDIADLSQARVHGSGTNSTTHGYVHGGSTSTSPHPGPAYVNTIDKFPFTSGSNATDVGDLTGVGLYKGGTQV